MVQPFPVSLFVLLLSFWKVESCLFCSVIPCSIWHSYKLGTCPSGRVGSNTGGALEETYLLFLIPIFDSKPPMQWLVTTHHSTNQRSHVCVQVRQKRCMVVMGSFVKLDYEVFTRSGILQGVRRTFSDCVYPWRALIGLGTINWHFTNSPCHSARLRVANIRLLMPQQRSGLPGNRCLRIVSESNSLTGIGDKPHNPSRYYFRGTGPQELGSFEATLVF